ncbi:uncharacterized protein BDV17DRAFT_269828 [Aspergillus undulatus]|uniref:uncharacterized protein n=1 Tax=Aspergillus undulatus TaxID=1810928 RepID=UPI003CCCCF81
MPRGLVQMIVPSLSASTNCISCGVREGGVPSWWCIFSNFEKNFFSTDNIMADLVQTSCSCRF